MKVSIANWGLKAWKDGDVATVIEQACIVDKMGIHQYDVPDHVAFVDHPKDYPYGEVPMSLGRYAFFDPLILLSAIASVTTRVRLATGILISPLRHAVGLAKQVATADCISNGRLDLGVGVGWLKEEYDAVDAKWEGRFGFMVDQLKVCRALWTQTPASANNQAARFEDIYSFPLPKQTGGPPVYLGIAPNERNFNRIAEVADGWHAAPSEYEPEKLTKQIAELRAAFEKHGRDPASCLVKANPRAVYNGGEVADLEATMAQFRAFEAAGVDMCYLGAHSYIRHDDEFEDFVKNVVRLST